MAPAFFGDERLRGAGIGLLEKKLPVTDYTVPGA